MRKAVRSLRCDGDGQSIGTQGEGFHWVRTHFANAIGLRVLDGRELQSLRRTFLVPTLLRFCASS